MGLDLGAYVRRHAMRAGSRLVPGLQSRVLRFMSLLAGGFALGCALLAWGMGQDPVTFFVLVALVSSASLWPGLLLATNERNALLGLLLAFALSLNLALFVSSRQGGTGPSWATALPVSLQQAAVLLGAGMLVGGLCRRVLTRGEDSLEYRLSRLGRDGSSESAGGKALKYGLLTLMPPIGRRRISRLRPPGKVSGWQRAQLLRQASGPLNPLGLALIFLPFIVLMTWVGKRDLDGIGLHTNPVLIMANGLIILLAYYDRDRLAAEMLRPLSRRDLVRDMSRALVLDVAEYWAVTGLLHVAVHAFLVPEFLSDPLYWGPFLLSPGAIAFQIGVAALLVRLGKPWMGLLAFLATWTVAFITSIMLHERQQRDLWIWAAFALGLGVHLLWMAPLGMRQLQRTEARSGRSGR
jgi:hypothetical protein